MWILIALITHFACLVFTLNNTTPIRSEIDCILTTMLAQQGQCSALWSRTGSMLLEGRRMSPSLGLNSNSGGKDGETIRSKYFCYCVILISTNVNQHTTTLHNWETPGVKRGTVSHQARGRLSLRKCPQDSELGQAARHAPQIWIREHGKPVLFFYNIECMARMYTVVWYCI